MFEDLTTYLNKIKTISKKDIWLTSVDNEVLEEVAILNTDEQLFNEGIDSNGETLGDYSEVSVEVYGKPEGHIKLYDEGDFYESFKVTVNNSSIKIFANDVGDYDQPLTVTYGLDILGLTEENKNIIIDLLKEKYIKYINERLSN